jgi:predicted nucleic acid-binding protein
MLADIPAGTVVFLDANIFVYHFVPHPLLGHSCRDLLQRISRGEIGGITSSGVLSNAAHRLMTYEASDTYGWPMDGIAYRLQQHPNKLMALTRFRQAVEEVPIFGVRVLSVGLSDVVSAAALSQQYGLLSGDALVVAMMQHLGIVNLASNDADFDRVPWVSRLSPA